MEFAPTIFQLMRQADNLSHEDLINSLHIEVNKTGILKNAVNKGGNGGSFFLFSADKRFIIKSITHEEQDLLLKKLLPDLYCLPTTALISPIYGVFNIKIGRVDSITVMLLGSIIPPGSNIIGIFDIKGSERDRTVQKVSPLTKRTMNS